MICPFWVEPFEVASKDGGDYTVTLTGKPFNDAYRYVDWLVHGHDPILLYRAHAGCGLERVDEQAAVSRCREPCAAARYLTVISWLAYPFVYIIKNVGLAGSTAIMYEQIGYSIADVMAKAVVGLAHLGHRVREICQERGKLLDH
jgi:hypothetical protein